MVREAFIKKNGQTWEKFPTFLIPLPPLPTGESLTVFDPHERSTIISDLLLWLHFVNMGWFWNLFMGWSAVRAGK